MNEQTKSNYSMLVDTVQMLSTSQGFYSRLWRDLREMSMDEHRQLEKDVNSLPQWKDSVDVVLWIEG